MTNLMDQNKKLFFIIKELLENKENTPDTRNKRKNKNRSAIWLTYKLWLYCCTCEYNQNHKSSEWNVPWKAANHKDNTTTVDNKDWNKNKMHLYQNSVKPWRINDVRNVVNNINNNMNKNYISQHPFLYKTSFIGSDANDHYGKSLVLLLKDKLHLFHGHVNT